MKHYPFVTLSGASGSGKTTLMEELVRRYPETFDVFASVTTRPRRPSDKEGAFVYLSPEEFAKWEKEEKFAWTVDITGNHYGTTKDTLERVLRDSRMSLSPIAPDIVATLRRLVGPENVFSIYILSLPPDVVRERLRKRGDSEQSIDGRIKNDILWDQEARQSDIPYHFIENTGTVDDLVHAVLALLGKEA